MNKPPDKAPPLPALPARLAKLEADREVLLPVWRELLEKSKGNISLAGRLAFDDQIEGTDEEPAVVERRIRNRALWTVRRLGLEDYARDLRLAAGSPALGRARVRVR